MSVSFTARGSGYYRVFVDGAQVSRHVAEREAAERAVNEAEANPTAHVRYDHDYEVDVAFVVVSAAPDTTAPTLSSATIPAAGTSITFAFSEPVYFGAGGNSGFAVTMSGGAATLTYSSGEGTSSLVYTTSRVIISTETGTCAYTQPTNGVEDQSGNDLVTFSGTSVTNNSTASAGNPLFFDDFNYTVTNDVADATANLAAFQNAGWYGCKADNVGDNGAGNLYTVDVSDIPGFSGTAPGTTERALCLNSMAYTEASQTDFYLASHDTENAANAGAIPADVWFQFWIYPCRSGAQQSQFHSREKFIYPCNGSYGCQTGLWIWMLGSVGYPSEYYDAPNAGDAVVVSRDNQVGTIDNGYQSAENKLGQTSSSELLAVNRWTLVKIHYDTSGPTGSYECWVKPQGGSWVKIAEWIDGVTSNFTWSVPAEYRNGHRGFKMPTTFPANVTTPLYNAWLYMQDFAYASSEGDLPTY